jgi:hypothetical protein
MEVLILDKDHQEFNGKRYGLHKGNRYYKRTLSTNGKKTTVHLHREVWRYHNGVIPEGFVIDHKDRDRNNNDISNLRLVTWKVNRENISPEAKEQYSKRMALYNSLQSGKWWQDEDTKLSHSNKLSENWKNREPLRKDCILCGKEFFAKHAVAKYCSKECRQENYFRNGIRQWEQKKITK